MILFMCIFAKLTLLSFRMTLSSKEYDTITFIFPSPSIITSLVYNTGLCFLKEEIWEELCILYKCELAFVLYLAIMF